MKKIILSCAIATIMLGLHQSKAMQASNSIEKEQNIEIADAQAPDILAILDTDDDTVENKSAMGSVYGVTITTSPQVVMISPNGNLGSAIFNGSVTINGDTGSASGSTLSLNAKTQAGESVSFSASTSTINLNTTDSNQNVIIGKNSGNASLTGADNVALGAGSLSAITTGNNNIAVGYQAGSSLGANASNNIIVGNAGTSTDSAAIRIGTAGTQTSCYIAGITGASVTTGSQVYVSASGQLGITTSSRRYKEDIKPLTDATQLLEQLEPVTFVYKNNIEKPLQHGLIAEDVEKINDTLVIHNEQGEVESVRYEQFTSILIKGWQEQQEEINALRKRCMALEAKIEALMAQR